MRRSWLAAALVVTVGCSPGGMPDPADYPDDAAAARALEAALAAGEDDPVLRYNLGTVLVRLERFEAARPHLEEASRAPDTAVRQPAYYNRGNADLEPAFAAPEGGPAAEMLTRAIDAYREALRLEPGDADAKWNLELARRMLQREPPPPSPGAGGGGGGGGGGDDPQEGRQDPLPQPGDAGGASPAMSQAQAERILAAAQQREVQLQRDKLRKPQPRTPSAH